MSQRSRIGDDKIGTKEFVSCDVVTEAPVDEQVRGASAQHLAPTGIDRPQYRTVPVGESFCFRL